MTPDIVSRLIEDEPAGPDAELGDLQIRVQPAAISMTVTDEQLLFSLPTPDGSFDATSEVHTEGEAAIRWGRRLFEHYWEQGTPVGQWIAREYPDAADSRHVHDMPEHAGTDVDADPDGAADQNVDIDAAERPGRPGQE